MQEARSQPFAKAEDSDKIYGKFWQANSIKKLAVQVDADWEEAEL